MTKNKTKSGTIVRFNVSPKGPYEGFLLAANEQIYQINFDHRLSPLITASVAVGQNVAAKVTEERPHPEAAHPVFRLVELATDEGKRRLNAAALNPDARYQFAGVVRSLNYALHGEVNGAILDSGDFLHVKPEGAKALQLAEGSKVKGVGTTKAMVGGRLIIEAERVNGTSIEHKPKGKKKPAKKHAHPVKKHA